MDNYIQCGNIDELCYIVARLARQGITYTADTATLRVHTTGGF